MLGGTTKPQTFLRSYTGLMAVQLTFELDSMITAISVRYKL